MQRLRTAVIASALVFVSCGNFDSQTGQSSDGDLAGAAATPSDLHLEDCVLQIGVFPIDASAAAPYLPDGFTAVPFQDSSPNGESGLPAPPGATATFQLSAVTCRPAGEPVSADPVTIVVAWLTVDPPDELEIPPADRVGPLPHPHVVVPWIVVSSASVAETLTAWGLAAAAGMATNEIVAGVPDMLQIGQMHADDSESAVRLVTAVPITARSTTPERLRMFGVSGRQLLRIVDFFEGSHTHLEIGTAAVVVESGTPSFPLPRTPGVAIHSEPGYSMRWERRS